MDNQVRYMVTATDMLSGKLEGMNMHATKLEGTLATVGTTATSMGSKLMSGLGMLGVGFGAFKGLELIHEGVEAVEKLHQAQAQVKAGLESTGYVAGVTAESLDNMAKSFSKSTKYSRADITDLQSLMLTFPAITKDTFPQATQAILDMSTRLGQDTKSSAIQLGKALQDPIRGITALRRVGVNFNDSQKDVIANLVATGQTAKAQTMILSELTTEFGGSAKAAADADPLFEYNKTMNTMKNALGEVAIALQEAFAPALMIVANAVKWVADGIKGLVGWFKENEAVGKALVVGLGVIATYYAIITTATKLWAIAQWALNLAMTANPIGLIVVGIGAVIGAVVYLWEKFAGFRAFLYATWEIIKTIVDIMVQHFLALKDIIVGVFTLDPDQVVKGLKSEADNVMNAGTRLAESAKRGWKKGMADFAQDEKTKKNKESLAGVGKFKQAGTAGATPNSSVKAKGVKDVTGTKNVTINISIGNLINDFQIKTTNIQESSKAIHDKVVMTLTGAVNDSQLIAGS